MILSAFVSAADKLRVVTEDRKPLSYLDANQQVVGLATEHVNLVLARANVDFDIQLYPWARAYDIALHQPNVLIYPLIWTPERADKFHYLCPLTSKTPMFLIRSAQRTDIKLTHLDDAKKYKIGLIRDDFDHQFLQQQGFIEGLNLQLVTETETNIKKLMHGRIDLMMESAQSLFHEINNAGYSLDDIAIALTLPKEHGFETCLALSLGTPESIIAKLRSALQQVNEDHPLIIPTDKIPQQ